MSYRQAIRRRMFRVLLAMCPIVVQTTVRAEFETPVAVTNLTIVTEPGTTIESGTIVIYKGRIVAVGRDVEVPPHAERIDGTGLFAYPGFIDAMSYIGIADEKRSEDARLRTEDVNPDVREGPLAATRQANRRGIRPQARAIEQYVIDKDKLAQHRKRGFTTALIAPRGGIFGGTSDLISLSGVPIRRSVLRSAVGMHVAFSAGEPGRYPRSLLAVFAQFRQVLLDAQRYVKVRKYHERHPFEGEPSAVDAALDALQPLLRRGLPVIFEANSEREIRRAHKLCEEFNLDVHISGAREAHKAIDLLTDARTPLIVSLKFDEEPEYGKKKKDKKKKHATPDEPDEDDEADEETEEEEPSLDEPEQPGEGKETTDKPSDKKKERKIYEPLKVRKERRRLWDEKFDNVIRLHQAGVPFALTTKDSKSPSEFFKNLRRLIERGLPEEAALAALTTTPAEMLGMKGQLGAIQQGYRANVAIFSAPFTDKKAKTRYVFVDGRKFEIDQDKEKDKKEDDKNKRGKKGSHAKDAGAKDSKTDDDDADAEDVDDQDVEDDDIDAEEVDDEDVDKEVEEDKGPTFAAEIKADRIPKTRTGGDVIIQNGTVVTVAGGTFDNASVLIRRGKITKIGRGIEVPDGVTIIDATGRYVIPGFVDCHSHLGTDGINEGTLSITAEVRIADTINPERTGIFRAVAGGTTTHHVMHGSANPIGGQNAILKLKYGRSADEMLLSNAPKTIKFALGENVIQSNRDSSRGKRYPNTRMGVEAVIREAFETALAYKAKWADYTKLSQAGKDLLVPRKDLRLEALAAVLDGDITVHSHCYRSDEILRLLAVAEDYGFRIGVLHHVLEGYRIAPEIARHGTSASTFSNFWAYKVEAYGAIAYNAALMTNHGINVSINSDSANTIRRFNLEAAKCIKWGGLNENEALRLVTLNPAIQLQIDERVGSLEVGKDGDVAIFNGHPLNAFSKCIMTLIEGEVYFEDQHPEPTERADALPISGPLDRSIPETPHSAYAIVGATVHPISGPPILGATVVIVEDKIHAVGIGISVPPGAGVIDAQGLHVYPGLIDAGTTLGLTEIGSLRATRDNREIGAFNPHLRAASAVHPHSEHIRIARTAGTTTALTVPSGSTIAGQSAVIHLDGWTADEMVAFDNVGLHMSVPSLPVHIPKDRKKKREKQHKESMKKLEDFIAKAKHYAEVEDLAANTPQIDFEMDARLEAMVPYVRGERPVIFSANSYKGILDTLEFAEKHGLRCIISGGTAAWKLADALAEKNVPVILGTVLSYPRGEFEPFDSIYRCAAVLDKAGVAFCFASNSASGAYNLSFNAGMAVAHGLPAKKAEYALTLGAAEILGIADSVGSIDVGKTADLIVTTGSPLQTVTQVTHMFIAGKPVELTSMHTENYEKFKNRPTPNLPPPPADLNGPSSFTGR